MGLLVQIGQLGAEDEHFKKSSFFFHTRATSVHEPQSGARQLRNAGLERRGRAIIEQPGKTPL